MIVVLLAEIRLIRREWRWRCGSVLRWSCCWKFGCCLQTELASLLSLLNYILHFLALNCCSWRQKPNTAFSKLAIKFAGITCCCLLMRSHHCHYCGLVKVTIHTSEIWTVNPIPIPVTVIASSTIQILLEAKLNSTTQLSVALSSCCIVVSFFRK